MLGNPTPAADGSAPGERGDLQGGLSSGLSSGASGAGARLGGVELARLVDSDWQLEIEGPRFGLPIRGPAARGRDSWLLRRSREPRWTWATTSPTPARARGVQLGEEAAPRGPAVLPSPAPPLPPAPGPPPRGGRLRFPRGPEGGRGRHVRAARGPVGPQAGEGPRAAPAGAGVGPGSTAPDGLEGGRGAGELGAGGPQRRTGDGAEQALPSRGPQARAKAVPLIPGPGSSGRSALGVRGGGGARAGHELSAARPQGLLPPGGDQDGLGGARRVPGPAARGLRRLRRGVVSAGWPEGWPEGWLGPPADQRVPQLGRGQPHGRQGGHQEAVPALPVGALRQARLPRAASAQAHAPRERESRLGPQLRASAATASAPLPPRQQILPWETGSLPPSPWALGL